MTTPLPPIDDAHGAAFDPDMPTAFERFEVLFADSERPPVGAAARQLDALVCEELLKRVVFDRADATGARLPPRIWAGNVPNGHLGAHSLDIETLRAQKAE